STKDGDNINDFVAKLTQHIEAQIGVTATFNVTEHYNIDPNSVKVLRDGSTYNGATVETNNGQITVTLPDEAPAGLYTVKYQITEKEPMVGDHLAATGVLRIQDETKKFPDVRHNPEDAACNLIIQKVDNNDQPLAGASFKVVGPGANGPVLYNGSTDATGKVVLTNLAAGTYYIKEVKAPAGYEPLNESIPVTIDGGEQNVTVKVENKKKTGTITVIKTDESGNVRLPGAEF